MATAVNVSKTGNAEIDGLLYGTKWTGTLTYTFPDESADYGSSYGRGENTASGFAQVSLAQQQATAYVMGLVASYTNLEIAYSTSNSADIRLATSSKANPTAYAYTPGAGVGGDVWFGNQYNYTNPILGNYYFITHIHEIGHALGLKHSQELGGVANVAVPTAHDAMEYTVMSYRSYVGGPTTGYTNEAFGYATTFMMNDILALQTLYGADYTTNSGDTVYTWNATTGQMSLNGVGQLAPGGNRVFMTVWDGGGIDTYDMSNYATGVSINLNPGTSSLTSLVQRAALGGGNYASGNVYNSYLFNNDARSYIENAIGGAGADTIVGNAIANVLDGRAGADTLTGGASGDTFVYGDGYGADRITDFNTVDKVDLRGLTSVGSLEALLAKGSQSGADAVFNFGGGNTLTLVNVNLNTLTADDFVFTAVPIVKTGAVPTNMSLTANSAAEGAATGTVVGTLSTTDTDANQTYAYTLVDSAGGRFAIQGDKIVVAGALNYETGTAYNVTVRVTDSGNQTYDKTFTVNVTNVAPTSQSDGNGAANSVAEGAANGATVGITVTANDPNGGATYSLVDNAGGRCAINATTGVVTVLSGVLLDYETATSHTISVKATDALGSVTTSYTIAVTDVAAPTINGNSSNNTLTGTSEGETINGNGGNDTIAGLAGADTLNGGSGTDTVTYAASSAAVNVSLMTGNGTGGDAQGDKLSAFEKVTGSSHNDTIEGNAGSNTLNGGAGVDTLSYANATAGVKVSLASTSSQSTGGAGSDTISNFENLTGSNFNDTLTGSTGNNVISGLNGNDTISAGNGNDTLIGGAGTDTLTGGSGADAFVFNAANLGLDTITDFASNSDWLQISASGFGGGLVANATPTLVSGADAAAYNSGNGSGYFFFDNSGTGSGTIYWDANGGSASDAVAFARINGTTLLPTDFHVV